jgi:hypothetical protein
MLEYTLFAVGGLVLLALARHYDGTASRASRDWLLLVLAVCVLGGILWEYVHRGFVLPFTW